MKTIGTDCFLQCNGTTHVTDCREKRIVRKTNYSVYRFRIAGQKSGCKYPKLKRPHPAKDTDRTIILTLFYGGPNTTMTLIRQQENLLK